MLCMDSSMMLISSSIRLSTMLCSPSKLAARDGAFEEGALEEALEEAAFSEGALSPAR